MNTWSSAGTRSASTPSRAEPRISIFFVRSEAILQHIDGVTFDEAWQQRAEVLLDEVETHLISAHHLVQHKLQSGRLRDLADEAIREANPEMRT